MMRLVTAAFLWAYTLSFCGQLPIPDYVPAEGLVAWIDFESNVEGFGLDFEIALGSINSTEDRFGEMSAVKFETSEDVLITAGISSVPAGTFAYSFWAFTSSEQPVTTAIHPIHSQTFGEDADHAGSGVWIGANQFALIEHAAGYVRETVRVDGDFVGWHHYVITYSNDAATVYVDGVAQGMSESDGRLVHAPLGSCGYYSSFGIGVGFGTGELSYYNLTVPWEGNRFEGFLDDFGSWNHGLTAAEVLQLYVGGNPVPGCTDVDACNFVPSANFDDGTCISAGCNDDEACNFDASAGCDDGSCDYSCCPGPGCCDAGMHWDWEIGMCQVTTPSDSNFDGCVQLNDLLDLLGSYGACGSGEPVEEPVWQCGEPVTYHGYNYATVQIGLQCWFHENLRSELYRNGDEIPSELPISSWPATTSGAVAVYGEVSFGCQDYSPDIYACSSAQSLEEYGRLYNGHAVQDIRQLCPTGWHVPSDLEWIELELHLGMDVEEVEEIHGRGSDQGFQMKTDYGWEDWGHGNNSSDFSALPGGYRDLDGEFSRAGATGYWWSSTSNWSRRLIENQDKVWRNMVHPNYGMSVRCIKNVE